MQPRGIRWIFFLGADRHFEVPADLDRLLDEETNPDLRTHQLPIAEENRRSVPHLALLRRHASTHCCTVLEYARTMLLVELNEPIDRGVVRVRDLRHAITGLGDVRRVLDSRLMHRPNEIGRLCHHDNSPLIPNNLVMIVDLSRRIIRHHVRKDHHPRNEENDHRNCENGTFHPYLLASWAG